MSTGLKYSQLFLSQTNWKIVRYSANSRTTLKRILNDEQVIGKMAMTTNRRKITQRDLFKANPELRKAYAAEATRKSRERKRKEKLIYVHMTMQPIIFGLHRQKAWNGKREEEIHGYSRNKNAKCQTCILYVFDSYSFALWVDSISRMIFFALQLLYIILNN